MEASPLDSFAESTAKGTRIRLTRVFKMHHYPQRPSLYVPDKRWGARSTETPPFLQDDAGVHRFYRSTSRKNPDHSIAHMSACSHSDIGKETDRAISLCLPDVFGSLCRPFPKIGTGLLAMTLPSVVQCLGNGVRICKYCIFFLTSI